MERLLSTKDIAERYQCGMNTARKYMRQMVHMEKPLMVTEQAVKEWESMRTYNPVDRSLLKQRTANRVYKISRKRA